MTRSVWWYRKQTGVKGFKGRRAKEKKSKEKERGRERGLKRERGRETVCQGSEAGMSSRHLWEKQGLCFSSFVCFLAFFLRL